MFDFVRHHRRWALRRNYRTRCQAVRLEEFTLVGERVLDLSQQGALVACDDEVKIGEEILLSFRSPWLGPTIDVMARVRRVVEGWRADDPGYCAGVHFLDLTPGLRRELGARLEAFPTVRSRRPAARDYAETVRRIGFGRATA